KKPAIAAEINDTSVAPNKSFKPKRATISPFSLLSDLIAPEIIPIELKLAKDTTKTEITPFACSLIFLTSFRSEEHTSELQSRFDLVCRLLLEKTKKNNEQNQ